MLILFKEPCIVFAGHPSLRFGDAVHLLHLWKDNAKNCIIITGMPARPLSVVLLKESKWGSKSIWSFVAAWNNPVSCSVDGSYDVTALLAPFHPFNIVVEVAPVDPRLTFAEAYSLLRETQPKSVALPSCYMRGSPLPFVCASVTEASWDSTKASTRNHISTRGLPTISVRFSVHIEFRRISFQNLCIGRDGLYTSPYIQYIWTSLYNSRGTTDASP